MLFFLDSLLLYSLLYNKSTTNPSSGVWVIAEARDSIQHIMLSALRVMACVIETMGSCQFAADMSHVN